MNGEHHESLKERTEREARVAKAILDEIHRQRTEAERKGRSFSALTEEQLLRKLRSVHSPMIVWQSWGSAAPGGQVSYSVGISNPDPTDAIWLFGYCFVGPANIAPDVDDAVQAVDGRFPRLTMPEFPGLSVKAGATERLDFSIAVPAGVQKSNYLGNLILFRSTWHDPGFYLDRSLFVFAVN